METEFARVQIPADAECPESLRRKWDGKIVTKEYGWGWSLEGPQDEGIALNAPDEWFRELRDDERAVAELLEATFWYRDRYTEDKSFLQELPQD